MWPEVTMVCPKRCVCHKYPSHITAILAIYLFGSLAMFELSFRSSEFLPPYVFLIVSFRANICALVVIVIFAVTC